MKTDNKKIRLFSLISFFMGFSEACFLYVTSEYLKLNSGIENVGAFYLIAYVLILLIFLNLHKCIRKLGKAEIFHISIFLKITVIAFLLFSPTGWVSIALVILYLIFLSIEWVSLDYIVETYSSDRMSGRIRGKYLMLMNAGIFLGPFLSTRVLEKFDYYGIFLLLLCVNAFISFFAIAKLKKVSGDFCQNLRVRDVVKKIVRKKNIRRIFYISFVLEFFYALMTIYTPIYLLNLGLGWDKIGIIFTIMLLPFLFLQYPMGAAADKKFGEKEFLIFSIVLMGLSTLAIFFIASKSVFIWSVALFLTRIGAALIEILRDSYFYRKVDGSDVDVINLFRTARPVAYIVAAFLSAVLLISLPVKFIFLLVAVVTLSAVIPAARLVDSVCEKEVAELEKAKRL